MVPFQYGGIDEAPDFAALMNHLELIISLCKEITQEQTESLKGRFFWREKVSDYPIPALETTDLAFFQEVAQVIGAKFPEVRSIYLFGSVARGDADTQSDVDLFILVDEELKRAF